MLCPASVIAQSSASWRAALTWPLPISIRAREPNVKTRPVSRRRDGVHNASVGLDIARYSERPELWNKIGDLSAAIWPEYNLHGEVLNRYWGRLYEIFGE